MKKITLNDNHRRSLTSSLMIVEKSLVELEESIAGNYNTCCFEVKKDVEPEIMNENLALIKEARKVICNLTEKYGTSRSVQSLRRLIDTKQTRMWEILCDSRSRKMKGFGEFPKELSKEYDRDIDELMAIISKIKY